MKAETAPFQVLVVCTGNLCRSPAAEALLRKRIHDAGAGDLLAVSSAGLATQNGRPMDPTVTELLHRKGAGDTTGFRSRLITEHIIDDADLLLTGTREHRSNIGRLRPEAYSRAFTLRECGWLLRAMPADVNAGLPSRPPPRARAVLRWLQEERGLLAVPESELDIADPIGRRTAFYRRMVSEVAAAVDTVADVLLPAANGAPVEG